MPESDPESRPAEPGLIGVAASLSPKVRSEPFAVPAVFIATRRKWYVRPVVRLEIKADTATLLVPAPALCSAVFVP